MRKLDLDRQFLVVKRSDNNKCIRPCRRQARDGRVTGTGERQARDRRKCPSLRQARDRRATGTRQAGDRRATGGNALLCDWRATGGNALLGHHTAAFGRHRPTRRGRVRPPPPDIARPFSAATDRHGAPAFGRHRPT